MLATFVVTQDTDIGLQGELRWAVDAANATPGQDRIEFAVANVALTQGELKITDSVVIDGTTPTPVLIDIAAAPSSRIFNIDDSTATSIDVTMINLQLRQGLTVGQGGAILNRENLNVELSVITENDAAEGGAIANLGNLVVDSTDIVNNAARAIGGGGIFNGPLAELELRRSAISSNAAVNGVGGGILATGSSINIDAGSRVDFNQANGQGGGIALLDGATTTIGDATIQSNTATAGGGIAAAGPNSSVMTGAATTIGSNVADLGGGIAAWDAATAEVRGSLVSGNRAYIDGGGFWIDQNAGLNVTGGFVTGNRAGTAITPPDGRGAGIFASGFSEVAIESTTFTYNGASAAPTSTQAGGGIFAGNGVQLTIQNSTMSGNFAQQGGAIYAITPNDGFRPNVAVLDSSVSYNFAYTAGGGIFAGPGTDLFLKCVSMDGNQALVGKGGAVYLKGQAGDRAVTANIVDSNLATNAAYAAGGGIASLENVAVTVTNSVIAGNSTSAKGGGIYLAGLPGAAAITNTTEIRLSRISGNIAAQNGVPYGTAEGGGVWAGAAAELLIDTTTIEGNTADAHGGGLAAFDANRFLVNNSTVSGNQSRRGGGAAVIRTSANFVQDTFFNNQSLAQGGGFYIEASQAELVRIQHSTISANTSRGNGGGLYAGNNVPVYALQVELDHTIVSNNFNVNQFDEVYDGGTPVGSPLVTAKFSLIRDNQNTAFAPGNPDPDGNKIGTPMLPVDAMLLPLAANGGPTRTMLPAALSPAVNAGDPGFAGPPYGDQRQLPYQRVGYGQIDMGAVELQPAPPTPDFDGDGDADCDDIDALNAVVISGNYDPDFDLNGDGTVNRADIAKWLDDAPDVNGIAITHYLPADINLDTLVDALDFLIWNNNKFTNTTSWCHGDMTSDGVVDAADFLVWNDFKFQDSPVPSGCGLFRNLSVTSLPEAPDLDVPPSAGHVDAVMVQWEAARFAPSARPFDHHSMASDRPEDDRSDDGFHSILGPST